MSMDVALELQGRVISAAADKTALDIRGNGSKSFLGRVPTGEPLDVSGHRGILSYEPKELVITARSGTSIDEINCALSERGQMLAFEPPSFGTEATIGGTVAAGMSGPRRPYTGSARDFVLGARILNGKGEILRFGGEVMKNVAGYDVSRLMTGAMGTLGVLLDISLKVLPLPAKEITLVQEQDNGEALQLLASLSRKPYPLSASCCDGERLYIRLSGAETAVDSAHKSIGGELLGNGAVFWKEKVLEQGHAFFRSERPLWRLSLPPDAPMDRFPEGCFLEWGGALRWLKSKGDPQEIFNLARSLGGHATLYRGGDRQSVYQPLGGTLMTIHRNLKRAFDPQGLFNPGRIYPDL